MGVSKRFVFIVSFRVENDVFKKIVHPKIKRSVIIFSSFSVLHFQSFDISIMIVLSLTTFWDIFYLFFIIWTAVITKNYCRWCSTEKK